MARMAGPSPLISVLDGPLRGGSDGPMVHKVARNAFEPALSRLTPLLDSLGFALASECHDYAAFGSAHAVFVRRGTQLRLVWDGKEQALHAEWTSGDNQGWRDVEGSSMMPQSFDHAIDEERLGRLEQAIRNEFTGRPTMD
jgi:hypothetical protein